MNPYSLDDMYVIFQQEPTVEGKLALLESWSERRTPYNVNWDALINVWSARR